MTDYLYTLPNSTSLDGAMIQMTQQIPSLTPIILLFIYCFVAIGGIIMQKSRTGDAYVPMWATIGGIATLMIALPMTLADGMINVQTLSVVVAVTILSAIWLFLDRGRNEI